MKREPFSRVSARCARAGVTKVSAKGIRVYAGGRARSTPSEGRSYDCVPSGHWKNCPCEKMMSQLKSPVIPPARVLKRPSFP